VLDRTTVLFDWIDQADPAHAALVMVDIQNDFVHADGWVAQQQVPGFMGDTGIEAVLDQSKALLDAARAAGVLTVFVRMLGDDKYLSPALHAQYRRNHGHERPPCVQEGTWGADFYGELRPDGRIRLIGRLREMYKSGGYNVYPREVEAVIEAHPGVETAAVVSIANPLWGEIGVAYVVPRASLTTQQIEQHCRDRLANYKLPKHIVLAADLPLLPIGKVDKRLLRVWAEQSFTAWLKL